MDCITFLSPSLVGLSGSERMDIILICGASISDLNAVCLALDINACGVVRFTSKSAFGLSHVYRALSSSPSAALVVRSAERLACSHFVVGSKKRRRRGALPPYWQFALPCVDSFQPVWKSLPLVITVQEDLARNMPIAPFWVRQTLGSVETKAISLIALNAFVSTLGGGHYLCKHVNDAWSMALRQQAIALALGDMELAGQCRIHLAYITMQTGKLKAAKRRLQLERKFAEKIESHKLLAVVFAAEVYLNKLVLKTADLKKKVHENDKLKDEFYRQRFVDVKKIRII